MDKIQGETTTKMINLDQREVDLCRDTLIHDTKQSLRIKGKIE